MGALTAITLLTIAWSLWIRRHTWVCKWQAATTLSVTLQGVSIVLTSQFTTPHLAEPFAQWTGITHVDDFAGHIIYLIAMVALVYNTVGRLGTDETLRERFKDHIERPATLIVPMLLATFLLGNGSRRVGEFVRIPHDLWFTAYWILLGGTIVYLLGYGCRALLVLRGDPRQRSASTIYAVVCVWGGIGWAITVCPSFGEIARVFVCLCAVGFAVTSARVWAKEVRPIQVPKVHT